MKNINNKNTNKDNHDELALSVQSDEKNTDTSAKVAGDEKQSIQDNENESSYEHNEKLKTHNYKLFSKEYFNYKFSKQYLQNNIKNVWVKYLVFFVIVAIVLILDLVLKSVFDLKRFNLIDGFISIDGYAHNTGAAFSMFSNATVFLLILSIICLLLYFSFEYLTMENKRGYTFYVATALMVGGTLGNLIDRIAFGYVRDFIKLEFIDFPIFNIADCALTIGVILLVIWLLFLEGKEKKNAKNSL